MKKNLTDLKFGFTPFLILLLFSCSSKNTINNTVEARQFLASHDWNDDRASITTSDGETHEVSSSIKFTEQEATSNKENYYYNIEKKEGGEGKESLDPYFEVTWFDNYLHEKVIFYLYENGGGSLVSTRWKLSCFKNVGKKVEHVPESKAKEKEEEYSQQFKIYELARNAPMQDTIQH